MAKKKQALTTVQRTELAAVQTEIRRNMRLEWRDPTTLSPHDYNWKSHPGKQRQLLRAFREEVEEDLDGEMGLSWFGALLYNERTGRLLDGHMRQQDAIERGEMDVPVLVVNVPAEVENKILMFLDLIGSFYATDDKLLAALQDITDVESETLAALLAEDEEEEGEEAAAKAKPVVKPTDPNLDLSLAAGVQFNYLVLVFRNDIDWTAARDHFEIQRKRSPWSSKVGVGHVVDGTRYMTKIRALEEAAQRAAMLDDDDLDAVDDEEIEIEE